MTVKPGCTNTRHWISTSLVTLLTSAAGCAGTGFGSELSVTPAPTLVRDVTSTTISLPQAEGFSIRLPQSTEQAGLDGKVDSKADVQRDGSANASVTISNGGQGTAAVQVGHVLKNDTSRQMDLHVAVHYKYEFDVANNPEQRGPGATVGIRLYARDQRHRTLRDLELVSHNTEQGGASRKSDEDVSFQLTLAPSDTIAVYIAGQAAVTVPEGRSASSSLLIRQLRMDIATVPAPAIPATSAPR